MRVYEVEADQEGESPNHLLKFSKVIEDQIGAKFGVQIHIGKSVDPGKHERRPSASALADSNVRVQPVANHQAVRYLRTGLLQNQLQHKGLRLPDRERRDS